MVREQKPSRAPLPPAKQEPILQRPTAGVRTAVPNSIASDGPQFGVPSTLGAARQSFPTRSQHTSPSSSQPVSLSSSDQSLYSPAFSQSFHPSPLNQSIQAVPTKDVKPADSYSNLFIPSKKPVKPVANPLLKATNELETQQQQPPPPPSPQQPSVKSSDDGAVKISPPISQPAFSFRPSNPNPPIFSSRPIVPKPASNSIDLTANIIGMATNNDLFHDKFGAADPHMYLDAGQATDDIKALLEGAFEDESDKPRTRRRRKQAEGGLEARLEVLNVKDAGQGTEVDEGHESDEDDGTVEGLRIKLLPHQVDGLSWMREKEVGAKKTRGVFPKGGILADDMGLGKTIQSIALILTNPKPPAPKVDGAETPGLERKFPANLGKGTLVVAPLALIKQWEGEIRDRVEDSHTLRVCVHHGPRRAKSFKELKKYDVVITTYHTLVSEHGSSGDNLKVGCFGTNWYRVILDEAHSVKNRNAKATKAACALSAEYRWCLTGTPMQNNLDELQSLIHFLRIKPYENLNAWRDQITTPMNNGRGGLAIKRLQVYLKAFMKRRTKDILKQQGALGNGGSVKGVEDKCNEFKIVKRTVKKMEAEFTTQERGFYKRLESRADKSLEQMMAGKQMSYASALVLLLRLRQACNHADLVKGDLAKERDALVDGSGSQTPSRRKVAKDGGMDSIAAMLGGLSVETKRCDICLIELPPKRSASGAVRCIDCEGDLEDGKIRRRAVKKERREKATEFARRERQQARGVRKPRRNVITDSDEEEDEGERIVSDKQRHKTHSSKAGGSGDEDAEGGGKWISSDTEDDGISSGREQRPVNLVSEDDDEAAGSKDEEASSTSDQDLSSNDQEDDTQPLVVSTKIRKLLKVLHRDCAQHKYIIFSFFTSMLDLIEPFLHRDGLIFTRYDGQMKNDLREASLERLRNHDKTRILLCSLRAGSLGLNLTAASRVVILEPFWNPFVEEQAIDRVHRLNQTQDVIVYKMTIKDTVEERILDLQEKKRLLADTTIEGKTAAAKLTMEDMLKLFRHDAEHTHQVDGIGLDLIASDRPRVLADSGGGRSEQHENSAGAAPAVAIGPSQRPAEHAIYGRRW